VRAAIRRSLAGRFFCPGLYPRSGHRRLLFLLLKFPQNHTIFEEKTNHKGAKGAQRIKRRFFLPSAPLWLKIL
jgi:hypothetical protein